ncbi:MAG: 16S rRNA (cytosine(967)-C(5))-methyltransferase RsmB [Evtepia sp.]
MSSSREAALLTLSAVERQNAWASEFLNQAIETQNLDRRDAALATKLCLGVLQNRMLLDFYLSQFSSLKIEKMESKVRNNLRLGLYQILFLSKIPQNAAVNEAVELTRKHCKNIKAPGMVNGILRNIIRKIDELPVLDQRDPIHYLSLRYSHPEWLIREFAQCLSMDETEQLLRFNNTEPPILVQVNTCKTEDVVASLEADGVTVRRHPWLADCLAISHTGDIERLHAFCHGLCYVQDPAAKLAVVAAGARPGMRVLDACAAPGGKSFAAGIAMNNEGEIVSCDIHANKKRIIEAGAARLGLRIISATVADSKKKKEEWVEHFDLVIADVPCSGLGVIRKKPEIRYKKPEDFRNLPEIQSQILETVSSYVKPGGTLLYSTCTLRVEENEAVVSDFLAKHSEFKRHTFTLPGSIGEVAEGAVTLWPHRMDTDGFFIAKLWRELCI